MVVKCVLAAVLALPAVVVAQDRPQWEWPQFKLPLKNDPPRREAGKCSIPLIEIRPQAVPKMPKFTPNTQGHMRVLKPPAPPCKQPQPNTTQSAPNPR